KRAGGAQTETYRTAFANLEASSGEELGQF
ncbi:unnamed protein product, partial [marine sediment metagenome]